MNRKASMEGSVVPLWGDIAQDILNYYKSHRIVNRFATPMFKTITPILYRLANGCCIVSNPGDYVTAVWGNSTKDAIYTVLRHKYTVRRTLKL